MDTEINNTIEGPVPEVILKTTKFHCALSNFSNTTECTFQCDSKEELKNYIEITHNKKTYLQCSVCMLDLGDLDALA